MTVDELALAYELRAEGCSWHRIGRALGHDARQLMRAVVWVCRYGLPKGEDRRAGRPWSVPVLKVECADRLRARGWKWAAIAAHLGEDRAQLFRCWRYWRANCAVR